MKPGMFFLFPDQNFLDLTPYQAGYCGNSASSSFGPCRRNHYLFHFVISGAGTLCCDGSGREERRLPVHTGQGFMIFPSQVTTYWADRQHPWEYVWIEFDGLYASRIVQQAGLTPDAPVYRSSSREQSAELLSVMMDLASPAEGTPFRKQALLYRFADSLIRSSQSASDTAHRGSTLSDYYFKTALSYIEQNYSNDISVESIAAQCNIHRNQLLRIFKEAIGQGPQEYLIKYRMSKAAHLLITTDLSVGETGCAVGYPNQLHFSRAFKHVYGIAPSHFRQKNCLPNS